MKAMACGVVLLFSFLFFSGRAGATGWLEEANLVDNTASQKQVQRMLKKLDATLNKAAKSQRFSSESSYVFDVETLKEIARKGIGLPHEMMFDLVHEELKKRYPGRLADSRRWIFNVAGGAMGQLTVLYCSPREYLIFFGTPIGTEGFSGRFKHADVWDIMMEGEMQTYTEGEFLPHTYVPGDAAWLAKGSGKGYRIKDHAWMLEYMRGNIIPALKFGIWSSTANVTLDWHSAWNQIHDCGKIALREIFGSRRK